MFNNKSLDIERGIILPEKSDKFAELIGILAGDGYVNFKNDHDYTITVSGHKIYDEEYHSNHVNPLFKDLFGLNMNIFLGLRQQTRYLHIRSKTIVEYLRAQGYYKYKGDISIPKWIYESDSYIRNFISGVFDTDGSLTVKKRYREVPYYPVISITSKNESLIRDIAAYLKNQGFNLWFGLGKNYDGRSEKLWYKYHLELNGYKNMLKWKEFISFSNPKHIKKYDYVVNKKMG